MLFVSSFFSLCVYLFVSFFFPIVGFVFCAQIMGIRLHSRRHKDGNSQRVRGDMVHPVVEVWLNGLIVGDND